MSRFCIPNSRRCRPSRNHNHCFFPRALRPARGEGSRSTTPRGVGQEGDPLVDDSDGNGITGFPWRLLGRVGFRPPTAQVRTSSLKLFNLQSQSDLLIALSQSLATFVVLPGVSAAATAAPFLHGTGVIVDLLFCDFQRSDAYPGLCSRTGSQYLAR